MGLDKYPQYECLKLEFLSEYVLNVQLNRAKQLNTMNRKFWDEVKECWNIIADDSDVRVVILSSNARLFTAGLDLSSISMTDPTSGTTLDAARIGFGIIKGAKAWQDTFNAVETCDKPTIAAIHGACIGGGLDFTSACDIRLATKDAYFTIKEIDIGIVADVGTLQRLPKIVGNESVVRELALTGRNFTAAEAEKFGFLGGVFENKEAMMSHALNLAQMIASKSPVATAGIKNVLVHARDHSVAEGLKYVAVWNASMIQTGDPKLAEEGFRLKKKPVYPKL